MVQVTDLFCGMGGFAKGFVDNGFSIDGYDIEKYSKIIFEKNHIGEVEICDLSKGILEVDTEIIIGGPPCKPWSSINITKRNNNHRDYKLLEKYSKIVMKNKPLIFIMENVPPIKNDIKYLEMIHKLVKYYKIQSEMINYSDYGAATKRRRFFTFGFLKSSFNENKIDFLNHLNMSKAEPKTVGDKIKKFVKLKKGDFQDHEWPKLNTIDKYMKYYSTGKYGWYILKMDEPAPSFGNVMKTYTLHPYAFSGNGYENRVVSVRENMAIMGFPDNFEFSQDMGISLRYQMVADTVNPEFSNICAKSLREFIN